MRCHDFDYLYICLQIAVMSLIVLVLVTKIVGLSSANPSCSHITNDGYTFDLSPMERLSGYVFLSLCAFSKTLKNVVDVDTKKQERGFYENGESW